MDEWGNMMAWQQKLPSGLDGVSAGGAPTIEFGAGLFKGIKVMSASGQRQVKLCMAYREWAAK